MQLKFVPKRGALPKWPGRGVGSYPYAGRSFDQKTRANAADAEPFTVSVPSAEAERFKTLCVRDGDVLPADAETARFCGVPFKEIERSADGEWGHAAIGGIAVAADSTAKRTARKESD